MSEILLSGSITFSCCGRSWTQQESPFICSFCQTRYTLRLEARPAVPARHQPGTVVRLLRDYETVVGATPTAWPRGTEFKVGYDPHRMIGTGDVTVVEIIFSGLFSTPLTLLGAIPDEYLEVVVSAKPDPRSLSEFSPNPTLSREV